MLLDIGLQRCAAGGAVGDVELQDARLPAQLGDLCLHGLGLVAARAAVQDDVVTGAGQAQGDGPADAAAGAGDQDGFSHCICSCR